LALSINYSILHAALITSFSINYIIMY